MDAEVVSSAPALDAGKLHSLTQTTDGRLRVSSDAAAKADLTLLSAASATGSAVAVTAGAYNWYAYGTWNGATAQLQWSPDAGTTWINVDGATLTANGGWSNVSLAAGHARVSFTGSPTSISSKLGGV